jgi:glycosyltransferase involved in cell wall biosynthesis
MKIAIVEAALIDPSRDAGARAIYDLQSSLFRLGFESEIFYEGEELRKQIHGYRANAIIISRCTLMMRARDFKSLFNLPIILWAQDLESRRQSLHEKLAGKPAQDSLLFALLEKTAISLSDVAVFPTQKDVENASRKFLSSNIVCHPYFSFGAPEQDLTYRREKDLVFIGSSGHLPNVDGLNWFLDSCWKTISEKSDKSRLWVIGDWNTKNYKNYSGVHFTKKISEVNVNRIMQSSMVGISPMRFGAGLKRKTLQYLHLGLLTVASDYGLEGLSSEEDDKCWRRANTSGDFVAAILKALEDPQETAHIALTGQRFLLSHYSEEIFDENMSEILNRVGL